MNKLYSIIFLIFVSGVLAIPVFSVGPFPGVAVSSQGVDTDIDGTDEFSCSSGVCNIDPDDDGTAEFKLNTTEMLDENGENYNIMVLGPWMLAHTGFATEDDQCLRIDEDTTLVACVNAASNWYFTAFPIPTGGYFVRTLDCYTGNTSAGWDSGDTVTLGVYERASGTDAVNDQIGTAEITITDPILNGTHYSATINSDTINNPGAIFIEATDTTDTNDDARLFLMCAITVSPST